MDRRRTTRVATLATIMFSTACTGDGGTASTSTAASSPPPIDTLSGATAPPPSQLETLGVALLGADEIGVPASWAIRDLDPALMDPVLEAEADPFQGLVTCPAGALRRGGSWLQRTFRAPEQPLDNGLLSVDLIIEAEDDAAAEAGFEALSACAAVGPETSVNVSALEIAVPDGGSSTAPTPPIPGIEVVVSAGPSADVPYPSLTVAVTARRDATTVTVVVGGVDAGVPLAPVAEQVAGQLLARVG